MSHLAINEAIESAPSEENLLARARALVPILKERAQQCEENRSVPMETIQAFEEAGFYRIVQPAQYGGYEMHPLTLYRVAIELAKGCPSSAWCCSLVSVHNYEMALFDPQAAEDVWGEDDTARISTSYAPFGKVEKTQGGYLLKGRWPWSSGSDHCQWVFLGALVHPEDGGAPDQRVFLVPRKDYEIIDTWHVMGLKGTGSKDILVNEAFVPEHRVHSLGDTYAKQCEGLPTFTSDKYKYPLATVLGFAVASVTLGIAEGALQTFSEQMEERVGAYDGVKAIQDPFVKNRLAEAEATIRGCHLRLNAVFSDLRDAIAAGRAVDMEQRVRNKWDVQFLAKSATAATSLLFKATGGSGAMLSNPMQRYFRDIQTASNHAFLNADKGSVNRGGMLLGQETTDLFV